MDIYYASRESILKDVKRLTSYLDSIVEESIDPSLYVSRIGLNSTQQFRKHIFDLKLSDERKIILKLVGNREIDFEIEGMKYAKSNNVPAPDLLYFESTKKNPFKLPFLLMEYVKLRDSQELFQGDELVIRWGGVLSIDKEKMNNKIARTVPIIQKLHQPTGLKNYSYQNIFSNYGTEYLDSNLKKRAELLKLFFEKNKEMFIESPYYPIHGDLDSTNVADTNNGIVLIDWEKFNWSDATKDIAYFMERNVFFDEKGFISLINNHYQTFDETFSKRLMFQRAITKFEHHLYFNFDPQDFLNFVDQNF